MKKYIVAICDSDYNLEIIQLEAKDTYNAVKESFLIFSKRLYEESKSELEYQESVDYPKTIEELEEVYSDNFSVKWVCLSEE